MKARIITDEDEDGRSQTFLISCLERLRMRSLDGICRTVHIYAFQGSLREEPWHRRGGDYVAEK